MDRSRVRLWVSARWLLTRGCALAIAWLTLCALANIQFAQAADDGTLPDELSFALAGFLSGQIAWVAIWSVLAPWPLSQRAGFCAIATLGILFSATTPHLEYVREWDWRVYSAVAGVAPLFILAVQSPLWAIRTWLGWRIVQPMSDHPSGNLRAASIRDFLFATACFGVALGLFRMWVFWGFSDDHAMVMASFIFSCGVIAFASLLLALPAVAIILRPHRGDAVVIWVLIVQTLILGFLLGVAGLFSRFPETRVFGEITSTVVSAFVTLDLSLFLARGVGYRLQWRKRAV